MNDSCIPKKYKNLNDMLKLDISARRYFMALPHSVQKQIIILSDKITDEYELKDCSENIMHEFV